MDGGYVSNNRQADRIYQDGTFINLQLEGEGQVVVEIPSVGSI